MNQRGEEILKRCDEVDRLLDARMDELKLYIGRVPPKGLVEKVKELIEEQNRLSAQLEALSESMERSK